MKREQDSRISELCISYSHFPFVQSEIYARERDLYHAVLYQFEERGRQVCFVPEVFDFLPSQIPPLPISLSTRPVSVAL